PHHRLSPRLRGNFLWLKHPIHRLRRARNGMQEPAIPRRPISEELLDVMQNRNTVAVITMTQQTAITRGGVDGFDAGDDDHAFAGVACSRVATVELPRSVEGEIFRRGVERDAMSLGDDVRSDLP